MVWCVLMLGLCGIGVLDVFVLVVVGVVLLMLLYVCWLIVVVCVGDGLFGGGSGVGFVLGCNDGEYLIDVLGGGGGDDYLYDDCGGCIGGDGDGNDGEGECK